MIAELNHMIDDVAPQDEAMDKFRCNFRLICDWVDRNGYTMRYKFKDESVANKWRETAEAVIKSLNLPLVAKVSNRKGIVSLNIIYKP